MFKASSERQHFTRREGSHSTKGRANGRVDILPPEARRKEELYQSAKGQFDALEEHVSRLKTQRVEIIADGGYKHKPWKLEKLKLIDDQLLNLSTERGRLATVARAAGSEAFGWCFMAIAEVRLTRELFREISEETERLMGRKEAEVSGGRRGEKMAKIEYQAKVASHLS